ncbi:hypothetical protein ITJ43_14250 [Microbacterium sp. VKM Ac-2870]|nr:hypothetical protein [Microbacterium sp. VKM Ac-2870]
MKSWPLALPAGYSLPTASQLQDPADGPAQWERGSGLAEAYGYWFTLTAVAAVAASRRGDLSASQVHLDTLVSAQSSTIARSVIDDPDGLVIREVITPARNQQDFSKLSSAFGLDRLDPTSPVARIARAAGDL